MKLWLNLLILLVLILAIGILADWWLPAVKSFAGLNSNSIQGISGILQIVLAVAAVLDIIWGIWTQRKKSREKESLLPPVNQTITGGKGDMSNISQNTTIFTGNQHQIYLDQQKKLDRTALRTAYLNHLFESTHLLSLTGVDPKVASEAEARFELELVYTALLTQSGEDYQLWQHQQRLDKTQKRLSAVEQLNREQRLVLLGDPGSGKTTFVNFVALCLAGEALGKPEANLALLQAPLPPEKEDDAADEKKAKATPQPWDHGVLIPVRVILRDFAVRGLPESGKTASARDLWNFIVAELERASLADFAEFLHQELLETGGILLIDGLDEVPEADQRRIQIKQAVEDFTASFSKCRILVTSRIYAYQKQDWKLNGFKDTVLAPFTPGQIKRFVDHWYAYIGRLRGLHSEDVQGRAELLKRAIENNDRLQALAERPLLLTLMASLHSWRGGSLPEHREKLYDDTVELLLDWWERPKLVPDSEGRYRLLQPSLAEWLRVDKDKIRKFLNTLAFQVHASQDDLVGTADIAEDDLVCGLMQLSPERDLRPGLLIDFLSQRAGLLIPRGHKIYTFPHRTFQEYLAACYLTDEDYPDKLAELALADPERWREVTLLAGAKAARGSVSSIWLLVEALCEENPPDTISAAKPVWGALFAGQVLAESTDLSHINPRNQVKRDRVKAWLHRTLRFNEFPPTERATAGAILGKIGDPRPEVLDVDFMQFCFVPAGPFWMGIDKADEARKALEKVGFFLYEDFHQTDLPYPFWISQFPVTNAQFQQFVKTGYQEDRWWTRDGRKWRGKQTRPAKFGGVFDLPNHPVVRVCWYEALAFTRWLTHHFQEQGWLPSAGKITLPNEAEWEKAARGGLAIPEQPLIQSIQDIQTAPNLTLTPNPFPKRLYAWGDQPDPNLCNFVETNIGSTNAPGCFTAGQSPYGCEEMSGNVWEWTRSLWGKEVRKPDFKYPYNAQDGREDLEALKNTARVCRGGAFSDDEWFVRCSMRYLFHPVDRNFGLGFRVVLSLYL